METAQDVLDEIARREPGLQERLDEVPGALLVDALRAASGEHPRIVLCDALGFRHEQAAVADLIACLEDESARVRSSAADALAKIADPAAGERLMARFELPDPDLGVRRTLISALGAVGHRPAIPLLIRWLGNPDPSQRGAAAWSLGAMRAQEAMTALEEALRVERIPYPRERIGEALRALRRG
jgi:HEAT repeat protein